MMKHAFLIMAHDHLPLLNVLLRQLDHPDAAVFLHLDRKAGPVSGAFFSNLVKHARFTMLPRTSVHWGGYSQIRCELDLLKAAVPGGFDRYHLLSGKDLLLRPVEEVMAFFDAHCDREFVHFSAPDLPCDTRERFAVWHPFQEHLSASRILEKAEWKLVRFQTKCGVDRTRGESRAFLKGANWFSITHALAETVLREKNWIRRRFRATRCCDEIFLQTIVFHSPFRDRLFDPSFSDDYRAVMRLIDWERGQPYTFREADEREVLASDCLFARKFDETLSPRLICAVFRRTNPGESLSL